MAHIIAENSAHSQRIDTGAHHTLESDTEIRIAPAAGDTLKGYEVVNWFDLVAPPAATPREVINRLHSEIVNVFRTNIPSRNPSR